MRLMIRSMFSNGQNGFNKKKLKTKICLVASSKYENVPRCIRTATSLAKDFNVEVVEFSSQNKMQSENVIEGINVTKLGSRWWPEIDVLKFFILFWKVFPILVKKRADVYHCSGFTSLMVTIPIKFLLGKKVIYDCFEHYPYQFTAPSLNKNFRDLVIWNFILWLENILAKLSDFVIVVPSYNDILLERFKKFKKAKHNIILFIMKSKSRQEKDG